jgi:hypothetical protein
MARILITNGGAHPPEKWATSTAERIFDIDSIVAGERRIQAQKFQQSLAALLQPHYQKVQTTERSRLDEDARNMLAPYDVQGYLDGIMKDIITLTKGTPWQDHFARPEVLAMTREVIGGDIATEQHVERMWHADQHPERAESKTYREVHKFE